MTTLSPIMSADRTYQEQLFISDITTACFGFSNQLVKCDPQLGKYMACYLLYKGDIVPKGVNATVAAMKSRSSVQFIDWLPNGFKVAINNQPSVVMPGVNLAEVQKAICMLSNSTAIVKALTLLDHRFDCMYAKRAFLHRYIRRGVGVLRHQGKIWQP